MLRTLLAFTAILVSSPLAAQPWADRGAGREGPFLIEAVEPLVLDQDLSRLPKVDPRQARPVPPGPLPGWEGYVPKGETTAPDFVTAKELAPPPLDRPSAVEEEAAAPAGPGVNFPGIGFTSIFPPDTNGDVGPNHYIQTVNANPGVSSVFRIWDKSGTPLAGPTTIASLWPSGTCASGGFDPVALYDHLADRWVISQVAPGFAAQCIAVSQTANPVIGGWFLYQFNTGGIFNDYAKIGVWPDAYYMGSQRGYPGAGADAWAFDRAAMLAGGAATVVRFFDSGTFFLPSDLVGPPPPAGAPNVFARFVDGAQFGGSDRLELFAFHVDFVTPANSTFTALPALATRAFDRNLCGLGLHTNCIPQPGTAVRLGTISAWLMYSLQYRNFGVHQSLVVNHTVDVDGTDHAGLRWYELRNTGGGWSILQQGNYAPDADHRWMGSVALDGAGNLALGYSISNGSSVFPSIRRSGRLASDPLGSITQPEASIIPGAGSQTAATRWGDYSAMVVDPVDDRTFWYTTEYIPANGNWETRIASFTLPAGSLPVEEVVNQTFSATTNVLTVACPAGTKVIGGGCNDYYTSTLLRTSAPNGEGWLCVWQDYQVNGIPLGFGAHAFCLAGDVDLGLQKVNTTTFAATSNGLLVSCPAGKRVVGGGCNDLFTSTELRTTVPYSNTQWYCEWEDAQVGGIPLGFSTDAFCINDYLDVGLTTVATQTFAATSNVQWVTCPAGKNLIGGGCFDFFTSTKLRTAAPYGPETWLCTWEDYQVNGIPLGFGTYAICSN